MNRKCRNAIFLLTCMLLACVVIPAFATDGLGAQNVIYADFRVSDPITAVCVCYANLTLTPEMQAMLNDYPAGVAYEAVDPTSGETVPGVTVEPIGKNSNRFVINVSKSCNAKDVVLHPMDKMFQGALPEGQFKISISIEEPVYARMKDDKAIDINAGRVAEAVVIFSGDIQPGKSGTITLTNGYFDNEKSCTIPQGVSFAISSKLSGRSHTCEPYGKKQLKMNLRNEAVITFPDGLQSTDSFSLTIPVYVHIQDREFEKVQLRLSGEAFLNGEGTITLANIINPFAFTFDPTTVRVSSNETQGVGKVVIAETDKDRLMKGQFFLKLSNNGFHWAETPSISVQGSQLTKKDFDITPNKQNVLTVNLTKTSNEATTLYFDKMTVKVDRTVPEGTYDLLLSGSMIDMRGGVYIAEDYLTINPNQKDKLIASGDSQLVGTQGEVTFTIITDAQSQTAAPVLSQRRIETTDPVYSQMKAVAGPGYQVAYAGDLSVSGASGLYDTTMSVDFTKAKFNPQGAKMIHGIIYNNTVVNFETFVYDKDANLWREDDGNADEDAYRFMRICGTSPFMLLYNTGEAEAASLPKTGDGMNLPLLCGLMALSAVGMGWMLRMMSNRKKRRA